MWALLVGCAALDGEPPVLRVRTLPDGALEVEVEDVRPGVDQVAATLAGHVYPLAPGRVELDFLPDGRHTLTVFATDGALRRNRTEVAVEVTVDRTPPALSVHTTPAAQGRTLAVWVEADEPLAEGSVSFHGREHPLYPVGDRWRALVGVAIRAATGPAPLEVVARDGRGNEARVRVDVEVAETAFERGGFIRLTKKQREAREDDAATAKMRAERDGAYATEIPEQRWEGQLRWPLDAPRVTSPFGKYRSYSDGDRSHHTGVDLDGRRGTPILASAAGQVLVAWEQAIHGNAVIVHHGQGVATAYSHLDTIAVEPGQHVEAGQVVGTLGDTGQATGPHLHWTLIVGMEAVDPLQWLEQDFDPGSPRAEARGRPGR